METLQVEWSWQEVSAPVGLAELAQLSGMSTSELDELVEYGALSAWGPHTPAHTSERQFQVECIAPLRTASKLRQDFDLDLFAVALLMDYVQRIDRLEEQVRQLQAQVVPHSA